MRPFTLLVCLFLASLSLQRAHAQETIEYLNEDRDITDSQGACYKLIFSRKEKNIYAFEERFATGELRVTGKIKSLRRRKKQGYWNQYYKSGKKDSEGEYRKGKREGTWKWYHESGGVAAVEVYVSDYLVSAKHFDQEGQFVEQTKAEKQPAPPEGMEKFYSYVSHHLVYPEAALKAGERGKVFVQFVVEKDGTVSSVVALNPKTGRHISQAAVEVVRNSPRWRPGKQHNRPVRVRMVLPITFNL